MKKNIKDYLHYYLGCEVWICNNIEGNPVYETLSPKLLVDEIGDYSGDETNIKPILRRLSDISRDEVEKCGEIIDPNKEYEDEYNGYTYTHFDVGKLFLGSFENNSDEYCIAFKKIMPVFHYILKQGFDLFGLIDAGLAIDKNCLKPIDMEKNEIIEGNKLIAEFDGMRYVNDDPEAYPDGYMMSEDTGAWDLDHLEYHESWDWLMPVVEKIESMGFLFSMDRAGNKLDSETRCFFVRGIDYSETPTGVRHTMKIVAVWQCVVQFIKWHNAQQK